MDDCCGVQLELVRLDVADGCDISDVIGLHKVMIAGDVRVCAQCGRPAFEGEVIESILDSIARAMLKPTFPLRGQEVRFLRKYMQLTQAELGVRIGGDRKTVARWEGAATVVPGPEASALRAVVAGRVAQA